MLEWMASGGYTVENELISVREKYHYPTHMHTTVFDMYSPLGHRYISAATTPADVPAPTTRLGTYEP
jgi:hypothetical protein